MNARVVTVGHLWSPIRSIRPDKKPRETGTYPRSTRRDFTTRYQNLPCDYYSYLWTSKSTRAPSPFTLPTIPIPLNRRRQVRRKPGRVFRVPAIMENKLKIDCQEDARKNCASTVSIPFRSHLCYEMKEDEKQEVDDRAPQTGWSDSNSVKWWIQSVETLLYIKKKNNE